MTPLRRSTLGFTLIEVLVALVVMAVLSGMAWQAVDTMGRTQRQVQDSLDRSLGLNTGVTQWEADLQALLESGPVPALSFDGSRLRLIRRAALGAQVVQWTVRDGGWTRWASLPTVLDTELALQYDQALTLRGNEPGHVRVAEGVNAWQVYYFRGSAWTNAQSTGDVVLLPRAASAASAGTTSKEKLPMGVRLVLTLSGADGQGVLTRDIAVAGAEP